LVKHLLILVIYRRYVPETVCFILLTIPLIFIILAIDGKFYEKYASIIFVVSLLSWLVFSFGKTIAGQRCYALGASQYSPLNLLKPQPP
jgi:rod shape determining protein RodA